MNFKESDVQKTNKIKNFIKRNQNFFKKKISKSRAELLIAIDKSMNSIVFW